MSADFHVIIPARYNSSRLPGKLMMHLGGQTVIERVYRQVQKSGASSILIAADNQQIIDHVNSFGASAILTAEEHPTGTDRIAEAVTRAGYAADDIIVNVQGDEPFIAPACIIQVARCLSDADVSMATLCWPIENYEQLHNPNVVKVVRDCHNNALYFSRSPVPANRDHPESLKQIFRHIGLYACRVDFLKKFVAWPVCPLEDCEVLEQLRILWNGDKIRVEQASELPKQDINTRDDLMLARESLTD